MTHRYGRHGPHAWLRRRKLRFARPPALPVPVAPPTVIVRVVVPAYTERVIVVIMPDETQGTWENENLPQRIFPVVPATPHVELDTGEMPRLVSPASPLQKLAEYAAYKDLQEIDYLVGGHQRVVIDEHTHTHLINKHANSDIDSNLVRTSPLGPQELHQVYRKAYLTYFDQGIKQYDMTQVTRLLDERERRLRARLSEDRQRVKDRDPGDWHGRDLVVMRWIQIYYPYGVADIGEAELLAHHQLLDTYAEFVFTEGKSEVMWPTSTSF